MRGNMPIVQKKQEQEPTAAFQGELLIIVGLIYLGSWQPSSDAKTFRLCF